jgi:membrane-bound metal-dependent hydrolase YbcI (DUF457 family)
VPLPLAHGLVGAAVVAAVREPAALRRRWPLLIGALVALIPDVDFLLRTHRTFTHSLAFALLVTGVLLAVGGRARARAALAYGLAFTSHGLLDFVTTNRGRGVQLLWPVSDTRYKLGLVSFSEFFGTFPSLVVIERCLVEAIVLSPLLLLIVFVRTRRQPAYAGEEAALQRDPTA